MSKRLQLVFLVLMLVTLACSSSTILPGRSESQEPEAQQTIQALQSTLQAQTGQEGEIPDDVMAIQATAMAQMTELLEAADSPEEEIITSDGIINVESFSPYRSYSGLPAPAYVPADGYHIVGERVDSGNVTWVVLSWTTIEEPMTPFQIAYVDLLTINRGGSEVWIENAFGLKDNHGADVYSSGATSLLPGERQRMWLSFYIEKDRQPAVLYLNADDSGIPGQRLLWDLGPTPCVAAVPDKMDGERDLTVYAIGETARLENLEVTVTGVSYPPQDKDSYPGYRYVSVDLIVENVGTSDVDVGWLYSMAWMKDAAGYYYSEYFNVDASTLFPGGQLQTQARFEIPEESTGLLFLFDASYLWWGKAYFDLD
ncbi:MAG: DUF4352 domain-containing protein [Chloroflexi bacterium]|nr:DUF4352 domain-containing protein [Chloroflexota bacterium]MBU1662571.1 DUF4352 domain-containing protein [Chloroflexota bacterium]